MRNVWSLACTIHLSAHKTCWAYNNNFWANSVFCRAWCKRLASTSSTFDGGSRTWHLTILSRWITQTYSTRLHIQAYTHTHTHTHTHGHTHTLRHRRMAHLQAVQGQFYTLFLQQSLLHEVCIKISTLHLQMKIYVLTSCRTFIHTSIAELTCSKLSALIQWSMLLCCLSDYCAAQRGLMLGVQVSEILCVNASPLFSAAWQVSPSPPYFACKNCEYCNHLVRTSWLWCAWGLRGFALMMICIRPCVFVCVSGHTPLFIFLSCTRLCKHVYTFKVACVFSMHV